MFKLITDNMKIKNINYPCFVLKKKHYYFKIASNRIHPNTCTCRTCSKKKKKKRKEERKVLGVLYSVIFGVLIIATCI